MPRRTRRRCVGKWEQIERKAREEELRELEKELHGEQRGEKPKPKRRQRQRAEPGAQDAGNSRDTGTDNTASDG